VLKDLAKNIDLGSDSSIQVKSGHRISPYIVLLTNIEMVVRAHPEMLLLRLQKSTGILGWVILFL